MTHDVIGDAVGDERVRILRHRATGHHLATRLTGDAAIATAAGAVGVRNVQGSALVSLHARVAGIWPSTLDEALSAGVLADVISARGTTTIVPARDVVVFTQGTLPSDEESLRARLRPFLPVLDASGHTAPEALALAIDVARRALESGPVDIGALSGALTNALPELSPMCRGRCGVRHIEQGLFDLVGESGVWRHEDVDGSRLYVPLDIDRAVDRNVDRERARAELVRRYLRCYGPSTAQQFAEWCGIGVRDARRSLAGEGIVDVGGRRYVLADDLDGFGDTAPVEGVRVLPPRDPYLLDRDRATLVPDRAVQRRLWRATPTDGVVLIDGEPVAMWRPSKKGGHLTLKVEVFGVLDSHAVDELGHEADAIARLRACESSSIVL